MKKYLIVPAPFLFTLLIAGLIWNTEAAADTALPQQEIRDLGTQQSQDLQYDYKPTENMKAWLISRWLMIGTIVSAMFLTILVMYDIWEGVRRKQLRKIYNQLERER